VKVFISHSKDEEWLVKLIAAELEKLGVTAYHYEQNEMGTLIQETIDKELAECDEFLVLLTPTSVKSAWVIDETAVAAYSRKKIVAFYMYVGDDDIPPRLRNVLRRHMGEIHIYYDELRRRMMTTVLDEQTKVHREERETAAAPSKELAVAEVQQTIRNPYDAPELRDLIRSVVTSSLSQTAMPPEPGPAAEPARGRRKKRGAQ